MEIKLTPVQDEDRHDIIDIMNEYIENSFAAYPETRLPYEFFDLLKSLCRGFPFISARNEAGRAIGFGMLRPYSPISAFSRTAEITYFIRSEWTGKGIGQTMLEYLVDAGKKMMLTSILASISSLNEGSIRFHLKNGFVECGRFRAIGRKKDRVFDVVYCQRMI